MTVSLTKRRLGKTLLPGKKKEHSSESEPELCLGKRKKMCGGEELGRKRDGKKGESKRANGDFSKVQKMFKKCAEGWKGVKNKVWTR